MAHQLGRFPDMEPQLLREAQGEGVPAPIGRELLR